MPLSTRRVLRRRAPATEADTAYAAVTNARRRRNAPREAMGLLLVSAGGLRASRVGFVLRRAFRHYAIRRHGETIRGERALQHHFGIALERVGHHAGIGGADDLAVALHLEPVIQRVGLTRNRVRHDEAMQLQLLAVPLIGL